MEEHDGLRFLYDKGIAMHMNGKVIDYHNGVHEGFSITAAGPAGDCGGCSCE